MKKTPTAREQEQVLNLVQYLERLNPEDRKNVYIEMLREEEKRCDQDEKCKES